MAAKPKTFAYWVAVVMAVACVATVILHQKPLPWKFEIAGVSLVWITAGAAIFAILIHESLDAARAARREKPSPIVRREPRVERSEKSLNQRA